MKRAVLPCNGLDKQHGVLARELALSLSETQGMEVICPVLLANAPARYGSTLEDAWLIVIDGCATRCASKLANGLGLRADDKVLVSEQAKISGVAVGESLRLDPTAMQLVELMAKGLAEPEVPPAEQVSTGEFEPRGDFLTVTHEKFIFRIPAQGYLFNENDCWVRAIGGRARVGVSDFVQQNMTDIVFFGPAKVGTVVEQFDEVGSIESGKSMMDALSPVSGRIVAVNTQLVETPELINEDPYGRGWIAEIELRDFDSDKALLLDAVAYSKTVETKAADSPY